jgi:hypothetical protein
MDATASGHLVRPGWGAADIPVLNGRTAEHYRACHMVPTCSSS